MAKSSLRVLFYDIETAPIVGLAWRRYDTHLVAVTQDTYVLSVAWKWLGEKATHVVGLPDFDSYAKDKTNDKEIVSLIHELLSEADIVVGHNADRFDNMRVQARMLQWDLEPPSPYKSVDTLKVAKRHFGFTSNKLGDLCEQLGLQRKADNGGIETWLGCLNGDQSAWRKLKMYNKQDVVILEQLYLRMLPWIDNHPNVATLTDRPNACPKCGAEGRMIVRGYTHNAVSRRVKYQCQACRGYCKGRTLERVATHYV